VNFCQSLDPRCRTNNEINIDCSDIRFRCVNSQIFGGGGYEAGPGRNQIGDGLGLDLLLVLTVSGSIRPATLLVLARARRAFPEVAAENVPQLVRYRDKALLWFQSIIDSDAV
jgi:hypothetical protein